MIMKLKTEDNVFMSYEYKNLFGLIRISREAVYVFSIYNKQKNDGSFKSFMDELSKSKIPVIMLNVRNRRLWHHFRHNGYNLHNGKVEGTDLVFQDSLIKMPQNG